LVTEPVILAQFEDLGIDEALDETKDIGVGAAEDYRTRPNMISGSIRKSASAFTD
jgi:hypothetical protein